MGAANVDTFSSDTTHVIFKDGSNVNYQKAKQMGLPILSDGWLEDCKREGMKMPEI